MASSSTHCSTHIRARETSLSPLPILEHSLNAYEHRSLRHIRAGLEHPGIPTPVDRWLQAMLINLPGPVNQLAHTDEPRLHAWYQKRYPKQFNSAITWMETQQPLLSLCADHWKAIQVLASIMQDYYPDPKLTFSDSSSDFGSDSDENEDDNNDDNEDDNDNDNEDEDEDNNKDIYEDEDKDEGNYNNNNDDNERSTLRVGTSTIASNTASRSIKRKRTRSPSNSNVPSKRGKCTAGLPDSPYGGPENAGVTGEDDVQTQGLDSSELRVLTVPELQSLLTDLPPKIRKKKEELVALILSLPPSEQRSAETNQELPSQVWFSVSESSDALAEDPQQRKVKKTTRGRAK
ncbi:hypothetical protein EVG20_g10999 [Dentipellis fragilis]|uniref:Uncharacterized protein n=1 Tax=Dentipellis fragilis TaxID=205917 RepID=A0A4Y9XNW2_9AGAM|nr:hypothetical protein EVG20_g10999 [Dentipellis fragilis]